MTQTVLCPVCRADIPVDLDCCPNCGTATPTHVDDNGVSNDTVTSAPSLSATFVGITSDKSVATTESNTSETSEKTVIPAPSPIINKDEKTIKTSDEQGSNQNNEQGSYHNDEQPLIINDEAKRYLSSFASWLKFGAVFGVVVTALLAFDFIVSFVLVLFFPAATDFYGEAFKNHPGIMLVVLLFTLCMLYACCRGISAANSFKRSLRQNSSDQLAAAFKHLRFIAVFNGLVCILSVLSILYGLMKIVEYD